MVLPSVPSSLLGAPAGIPRSVLLTATVAAAACLSIPLILQSKGVKSQLSIPSPRIKTLPVISEKESLALPYPLDALPGGRDVETPYGSIRVYEWGPEDGEKVLFVHGISTPCISLGDLGHEFVGKGCRVMLFDLFGRGYSDAPSDLVYDARLYVTQFLLVLASSKLSWTNFNLVGYSLGGGLCVLFSRYFPHQINSLILVASCGLIRPYHVGWKSWLLYSSGLLPDFLVKVLVRRRIRPEIAQPPGAAGGTDIASAEVKKYLPSGDGDSNGGARFDSTSISKFRPDTTVSSVVRWQVDHHDGFVTAFLSTIRNAPIYAPQRDWKALNKILEGRREDRRESALAREAASASGLHAGKILMILGEDDPIVVKEETIEDAHNALGADGVEISVLPGGHEIHITASSRIADAVEAFWRKYPA
ncbi:alpha/beta-hydrolase [Daldinia caldariorum]|uniref:alpha/beta-hydrolase n=1 Tax=Daldinia caldariorum TaxID=326644 RepID=UPI002007895A|nr:alpha/beta-hydrolase [Daldinia caldariorum]KAI1469907.1 alpha/beta-hydrolase [Daldinia caldariorum]